MRARAPPGGSKAQRRSYGSDTVAHKFKTPRTNA